MTLDEASNVVQICGKFLEVASGQLTFIFGADIPESLLPYSKGTIQEAFQMITEYHQKNGNQQMVEQLQFAVSCLMMCVDDEEALLEAAKKFNDPKWRDVFLPRLKKLQSDRDTKNFK